MEINRGIMYFSGGGDADKTAAVDLLFLTNLFLRDGLPAKTPTSLTIIA